MVNNEALEAFFLDIANSPAFDDIAYMCITIRKAILEYISRKREQSIDPFMKPLHDYIKSKLVSGIVDIDDILSYMVDNDANGWCFHFVITRFRRKEGISEDVYCNAVNSNTNITSYIEIDFDRIATLTLGFVIDFFSSRTIDIQNIIKNEKFAYSTNQHGLTNVNGANFKIDGLIFDKKYYLYSLLTNTSVMGYFDEMPAFARIITEQINNGDILYRLDERLSVPENQIISYSTLNSEKFYGSQFKFSDSVLKAKKAIIVHIDENTMDKLLMVIKQRKGVSGEAFWHIEIETLPYIDEQKNNTTHIITTFLHGMYYPDRDMFTHIDYTKNQYDLKDYLLKYSESTSDVPIDYYTEKELHYKIWCVENGEYSRKTWYDFMIASLPERYQKLLNEILE